MSISGAAIDAGYFAKLGHKFVGAAHGAGESSANPEVELARSLLAEAGIERDNLDNFDRSDAKFICDPFNGLRTDETVTMLNFVKKGKDSRAALVIGVLCDAFVGSLFESRSDLELREMNYAWGDR